MDDEAPGAPPMTRDDTVTWKGDAMTYPEHIRQKGADKPVAWMLEGPNGERELHWSFVRTEDDPKDWTETPLYPYPAALVEALEKIGRGLVMSAAAATAREALAQWKDESC
jgi:hypothetical protein